VRQIKGLSWFSAASAIVAVGVSTSLAQAPAGDAGAAAVGSDEAAFASLMEQGERIFRSNCDECHGEGQIIGQNDRLSSVGGVLIQIIEGGERMPPFGQLTDTQIAAVATFVRNSFGNSHGVVTEADVAEWRL